MMYYRPMMNDLIKGFEWLIDLIPTGRQDAVSMTDLARLTGLPTSDIRQMILNARKVGVLICSGDAGYYFPSDEEELVEYSFRRKKYIKTAMIALQPFEDVLNRQKEGDPG